jgi:signal transduction histidine kinase
MRMVAPAKDLRPSVWVNLQNRAVTLVVFAAQFAALAGLVAYLLIASQWLKRPFMGAFIENTLRVSTAAPVHPGSWPLQALHLSPGQQIIALDGQPVLSVRHLEAALSTRRAGEQVVVGLRSPAGRTFEETIPLIEFPLADLSAQLVVPLLVGLIFLGAGSWVFSQRWNDPAGRAFSLFTCGAALALAGWFDTQTSNQLTLAWMLGLAAAAGALFNLAMVFPRESGLVQRYPYLGWLGYMPALILALIAVPTLYNPAMPSGFWSARAVEMGLLVFSMAVLVVSTGVHRLRSRDPQERDVARLIFWTEIYSFGGALAIYALAQLFNPGLAFTAFLPLAIFPVLGAYALLRHRLVTSEIMVDRLVLYALLTLLVVGGYALLLSGLGLLLGSRLPPANPLLVGLVLFLLALGLDPLRQFLRQRIDTFFFRGQALHRQQVQDFSRELTQALDIPAILSRLRETIEQGVVPSQVHIFLHNTLTDQYTALPGPDGRPTSDLSFPSGSPLVSVLSRRREALFTSRGDALPAQLAGERTRLAILGAELFVPLPGQQHLVGWLALGPRRSGTPYTRRDLAYLEALADQAALAVERAQVVADLERRIQEMDVLTRIAQGINITLAFDDLLELIYAQTTQVIPAQDLRITLKDTALNTQFHAFYVENDERLNDFENKPLPEGQGLVAEVIASGQAMRCDDYEHECRSRGALVDTKGLYAWMGVPLNSGSDTIGAISLANRDPAVTYTEQQCSLLQAIADQAAGAIVKARLLDESERRTRQLATLNEIGRSLTSTLETRPLLKQILDSAIDILNCEAGSLFLVDEGTGEIVFEVVAGPVAGVLVGTRLPPGTGLVGKAVDTGQPVIANNVHRDKAWFEKVEEKTGFVNRDLLVVPMFIKDRVIGVIEVINKKDFMPFGDPDAELLATFSSQAAVAIENARLYTQTDQALASRVEELSMMQRIDRELNASLDVNKSMRTTLEWALRQSRADAGLVGLVQEDGLRVMAAQGYAGLEASPAEGESPERLLQAELPAVKQALASDQPCIISFEPGSDGNLPAAGGLLAGARTQLVVPIRREAQVNAVLLLESTRAEGYSTETVEFLSRLGDHAAIAISNSQLYSAVQAANQAKSEFVSLVSHELKTPMTSIKGYADLLAAGAVGPVSDVQANFLNTIRSNVSRMATLVSDLADVSRIEAGRLRLEFNAVSVDEAVQEVVRSAQAQINEKQQVLTLDYPADLPPVWADRTRLIQIMVNLVSNANKYTPAQGSLTIRAERAANRWDPKGAHEVVHFSVQDTGYGIAPADQDKIFTKFFRADDQAIRESPGTGLGLNITRYLVEVQGGQIWFESALRKGTTFHFTIPVAATKT